ncbi:MAG: cytochrome c oxidase subunit 3 [Dehalococcoidia bacterium]
MGEVLVVTWDLFPVAAAEEAHIVDDAFRLLMVLAMPVVAFVLAALVYTVLRFRRRREPAEDGPPTRIHKPAVGAWLVATTALTIVFGLGRNGRFTSGDSWGVEGTVKYWHFVDVAWVFIYPTLNLVN